MSYRVFQKNQTWYDVSPVYVEFETERFSVIACTGKKLSYLKDFCDYFEKIIWKFGNTFFRFCHRIVQIEPSLGWSSPFVLKI